MMILSGEMSKYRFLLVEPDVDRAQGIQAVLKNKGIICDHVQSHLKGLALIEDNAYHCLLVSSHGLDLSGFELCTMIRVRESRRSLASSFLLLLCSEEDHSTIFSNTLDIDDYIVAPWLDLELNWKVTRALKNLALRQTASQVRNNFDHPSGLLTQNCLQDFLYEEVNRVGRRHGWFSLSILSISGLDSLRISYGNEWLAWFKDGIWAFVYGQLRNYDRLAVMDTGLLGLISPDLDEGGTLSLLHRLDRAIGEYQLHQGHDQQNIALAARYLCVRILGDYKQFERAGDVLWQWLENTMLQPLPQGMVGHAGTVAFDLSYM
ncbi:MAG: hypothetical protein RBR42_09730 [Desulfomicrobium sp.]|nr:hypothetical protein [Desulfomicrobium sp.]